MKTILIELLLLAVILTLLTLRISINDTNELLTEIHQQNNVTNCALLYDTLETFYLCINDNQD